MKERSFPLFHTAVPVHDLGGARAFYASLLGCVEGKSTPRNISFEFFGHHLITHLVTGDELEAHRTAVNGVGMAVRHFGVALPWAEWEVLRQRLVSAGATFVVKPTLRHRGEPAEEALMLLADPSGNVVEFKTYRDIEYLFSKN